MKAVTAMFVGFSCTACDRPVEGVLASAEADQVGASTISIDTHARRFGHIPPQVRYYITPAGWPEGGES